MKYRIEEKRTNNKGGPNFRPWRIVTAGGRLVRCYTSHAIALVALDLLEAGHPCPRREIYRRLAHGQG